MERHTGLHSPRGRAQTAVTLCKKVVDCFVDRQRNDRGPRQQQEVQGQKDVVDNDGAQNAAFHHLERYELICSS